METKLMISTIGRTMQYIVKPLVPQANIAQVEAMNLNGVHCSSIFAAMLSELLSAQRNSTRDLLLLLESWS